MRRRDARRGEQRAAESKVMRRESYRLPEGRQSSRPYYCRSCAAEVHALHIPKGWYSLGRHPGNEVAGGQLRLGLFCSAACVVAFMPRVVADEESLGDQWTKVRDAQRTGFSDPTKVSG